MKVKEIGLCWITVSNFAEAIKYYTEVVGLKVLQITPEYGWAELEGYEGGSRLGIGTCQGDTKQDHQPGQHAVVTFTVENLEKVRQEILNKGATCEGEIIEIPGHVKMQTVLDLDGNRFQLCEILSHSCPTC